MLKSSGTVTPGGNGIGLRSTGTGVIVICRTGLPSGPIIRVPWGMVTTRPGIVGVAACTVVVVAPVASVGSVIVFAVSSFGRYTTNGTRVGPLVATDTLTSTGGYCAAGVDAVRPSTSSMLAPAGGAS